MPSWIVLMSFKVSFICSFIFTLITSVTMFFMDRLYMYLTVVIWFCFIIRLAAWVTNPQWRGVILDRWWDWWGSFWLSEERRNLYYILFWIFLKKNLKNSHSLIHSLLTCWTTFVFMSMLKSHSLIQSLIHALSTCCPTFVFMCMLKSHCL